MALFQTPQPRQGMTVILVTHEPDIAGHARRASSGCRTADVCDDRGPARTPRAAAEREAPAGSGPEPARCRHEPAAQLALRAARGAEQHAAQRCSPCSGIIIGVASVIAIVAIGKGAQAQVTEQIQRARRQPAASCSPARPASGARAAGAAPADADRGRRRGDPARDARRVVAAPSVRGTARSSTAISTGRPVSGVTPDYLDRTRLADRRGRPFTADDIDGAAKVVAARHRRWPTKLFGTADPLGPGIRSTTYRSRWSACSPKGQNTAGPRSGRHLLVPLATAQVYGSSGVAGPGQPARVDVIMVKAASTRRDRRGPGADPRRCCASATAWPPSRTTISACAT